MKSAGKIIIVDDEPAVADALSGLLRARGHATETFLRPRKFVERLPLSDDTCVVLDLNMPDMDGMEVLGHLRRANSRCRVIVLTGYGDIPKAVAAIKGGATDFLEKPVDDQVLFKAIEDAAPTGVDFPALDARREELRKRFDRLTPREIEVMDLLVRGYTNAGVGEHLGISAKTVEHYRARIGEKLDAGGLADIVRAAIALGRLYP